MPSFRVVERAFFRKYISSRLSFYLPYRFLFEEPELGTVFLLWLLGSRRLIGGRPYPSLLDAAEFEHLASRRWNSWFSGEVRFW